MPMTTGGYIAAVNAEIKAKQAIVKQEYARIAIKNLR
jgi:hypothetical protein